MATLEGNGKAIADIDAEETREWIDSLDSVVRADGADRARFLVERLVEQAGRGGASPPPAGPPPHVKTIPAAAGPPDPRGPANERAGPHPIRRNPEATRPPAHKEGSG